MFLVLFKACHPIGFAASVIKEVVQYTQGFKFIARIVVSKTTAHYIVNISNYQFDR